MAIRSISSVIPEVTEKIKPPFSESELKKMQELDTQKRESLGLPPRVIGLPPVAEQQEPKRMESVKSPVKEKKEKTNTSRSVRSVMSDVLIELYYGDEKLEKGFTARSVVIASMPHSKPESNEFTRKNGNYTLNMIAPSEIGLPYGTIPRLLLAWITTEAVRTKSRTLFLGKSLSEFLDTLGIPRTGNRINALKEQMKRLFNTSISCIYENKERMNGVNMHVTTKYDIWWAPQNPEQISLAESTITLDENFFNEITKSPVVFYMDALKVLKKSPMALDIYLWLTYKNSYAKEITSIPWEALQYQFGADYSDTAEGKRNFKKKFLSALKKIAVIYPEAKKIKALDNGLLFVPGLPHVAKTK